MISDKNLKKYPQRAQGKLKLHFTEISGETNISHFYQSGSLKALLPKPSANHIEAILINTSGGLAGGDELLMSFETGPNTKTSITTQAAEKVYKSAKENSIVEVDVNVGENGYFFWCPQETILFHESRMKRTLNFQIRNSSKLLIVENIIFGRQNMGEQSISGQLVDRWRISRENKLVLAENFIFNEKKHLSGTATLGDNHCISTVIYASHDAENYLESTRALLNTDEVSGGASCWNYLLIARIAAKKPEMLKGILLLLLRLLSKDKLPRIWAS